MSARGASFPSLCLGPVRHRSDALVGVLGRPRNEMPYLLLVVGHPAEGCRVPDIQRLPLDEVVQFR